MNLPYSANYSGDLPSPARADSTCAEVLECMEPVLNEFDHHMDRQILLVRTDGVIVPSQIMWSPLR